MKRLSLALCIAAVASIVLAINASGAASAPIPSCAIDENGECMSGNPLDAYTDVGWFEADVDVWYDFSAGQYCFNANGIRRGSFYAVHFSRRNICVNGSQVTTLGGQPVWFTGGLPYGLNYITTPDLNYNISENGVGTGLASSTMNFNFRWCGIVSLWNVGCGLRVYGSISIYVGGDGGLSCWSDRGYIPSCRGRVGG